jgi:hypothetical protein
MLEPLHAAERSRDPLFKLRRKDADMTPAEEKIEPGAGEA